VVWRAGDSATVVSLQAYQNTRSLSVIKLPKPPAI
jgi:hypothetical protein